MKHILRSTIFLLIAAAAIAIMGQFVGSDHLLLVAGFLTIAASFIGPWRLMVWRNRLRDLYQTPDEMKRFMKETTFF